MTRDGDRDACVLFSGASGPRDYVFFFFFARSLASAVIAVETVVDGFAGIGSPWLVWAALRQTPGGGGWIQANDNGTMESCKISSRAPATVPTLRPFDPHLFEVQTHRLFPHTFSPFPPTQ